MDVCNKNIFKHICEIESSCEYFGREIRQFLTPSGRTILMVIPSEKRILLIAEKENSVNEMRKLMELLSYLKYAEENHLIYVQCTSDFIHDYILYENCDDCKKLAEDVYRLGENVFLRNVDEMWILEENGDTKTLQQYDASYIYNEIKHYLFSRVFAASGLIKFIEHDFMSEQDYYSNRSLCVSRWSLRIAVAVFLLSSGISLWLGMHDTIINKTQYDGIINRMRVDTVYAEKCDTMRTVSRPFESSLKK